MGNELTTANKNAVATANDNPWLAASSDSNDFDGNFLKLNGNTGEYTYGQEGNTLDVGSQMVVYMAGVQHGYICWKDGEVIDRAMSLVELGTKPALASLADHGPYEKHADGTEDGWAEHHQLPMIDPDDEKFMLQASSGSAVRSIKRFYTDYGKKRSQQMDADGNYMLPVVELEVGNFTSKTNKRAGKKYFPELKIVNWVSMKDFADKFGGSNEGDDPEAYVEQAQATAPGEKNKVQEEITPEPEPVQEPVQKASTAGKKFGAQPEASADTQTTKASANAAAAAKASDGGRRSKRF